VLKLKTFFETVGKKMKCIFIEPAELSRAYDRLVSVCVDIVFVDSEDRFVLAKRKIHSAQGWWWKGGSMRRGENIEEAISRLIKREIGFVPEGVTFLEQFFHEWDMRAEEPCGNGKHDLIFLHFARVDEETIRKIRLDKAGYDADAGFMRYDGTQKVRPAVADMYRKYIAAHATVRKPYSPYSPLDMDALEGDPRS
jgi:ADP-ribose pyrophosphatase YjhB (NUDIX family)